MKRLITLLSLVLTLFSCTNDPYESGDGDLSNMRADFVEAYTDDSALLYSVLTDDGESLQLTQKVETDWAETADSVYRSLLYYNKVEASDGTFRAEPLAVGQVPVLRPLAVDDIEGGLQTDPVCFDSAWMGRNGKYINLDLNLKVGRTDDETAKHTLGVVYTAVEQRADGTRLISLTLHHAQNGVPEYYSAKVYASIPVSSLQITPSAGDEVLITINTYDGKIEKSFVF